MDKKNSQISYFDILQRSGKKKNWLKKGIIPKRFIALKQIDSRWLIYLEDINNVRHFTGLEYPTQTIDYELSELNEILAQIREETDTWGKIWGP